MAEHTYTAPYMETPDWSQVPAAPLTHAPWLPPCAVSAAAQVCYCAQGIWVKLEAVESPIRATLTEALSQVCDDSCLEFFLAPERDDPRYFNIEFNPLGCVYLGFGGPRSTRMRLIPKQTETLLRPAPYYTEVGWGIEFFLPLTLLHMFFPSFAFENGACCNFYKCGDCTETPHYLAWAPLSGSTPDFHRRQDFGTLAFAL